MTSSWLSKVWKTWKTWKSQGIKSLSGKPGKSGRVREFYWRTKNNLERVLCFWKQCFFILNHPQNIPKIKNCCVKISKNCGQFCLENLEKSGKCTCQNNHGYAFLQKLFELFILANMGLTSSTFRFWLKEISILLKPL